MLQSIDGIDVFKRPAQEVSALLLGPIGSAVNIGLFRELVRFLLQSAFEPLAFNIEI